MTTSIRHLLACFAIALLLGCGGATAQEGAPATAQDKITALNAEIAKVSKEQRAAEAEVVKANAQVKTQLDEIAAKKKELDEQRAAALAAASPAYKAAADQLAKLREELNAAKTALRAEQAAAKKAAAKPAK